jgi:hypothetical protein
MKYRVKKRCQLLYPDGSVRGEAGYIVDLAQPFERETLAQQEAVLERCRDRQAPASPVDLEKMQAAYGAAPAPAPAPEPASAPEPEEESIAKDKSFMDGVMDLVMDGLDGWKKLPKGDEDFEE